MLGELLEISIDCEEVLDSLDFWQRAGFTTAPVGDVWPHRYGVVTDGRICLGLHDFRFPSPSLTFVTPELGRRVEEIEARGVEMAFRKLGADEFNEAGFHDPSGQTVCLLEARTFSPPPDHAGSLLGHFRALRRRSRDPEMACRFWESLGVIQVPGEGLGEVSGNGFNLQFDPTSREVELVFEDPDPAARAEALEPRGIDFRVAGKDRTATAPDGLVIRITPPEEEAPAEAVSPEDTPDAD